MLRYKLRITGEDINIDLPAMQMVGIEKDNVINFNKEVTKFIPKHISEEKFLFENTNAEDFQIDFYFNNTSASFIGSGDKPDNFTEDEINKNTNSFLKSLFVVEVYDETNVNSQRLLDTFYIHNKTKTGFEARYDNTEFQSNIFRYLSLPEWFVERHRSAGVADVYLKSYFFNAKSGKTYPFYPKGSSNLILEKNHYLTMAVDLNNFTFNPADMDFQYLDNDLLKAKLNKNPAIANQVPVIPNNKIFFFDETEPRPELIAEELIPEVLRSDGTSVVPVTINEKGEPSVVETFTATMVPVSGTCDANITVNITLVEPVENQNGVNIEFIIDPLDSNTNFKNSTNSIHIPMGSKIGSAILPITFTYEDETLCGNFTIEVNESTVEINKDTVINPIMIDTVTNSLCTECTG